MITFIGLLLTTAILILLVTLIVGTSGVAFVALFGDIIICIIIIALIIKALIKSNKKK